MGPLYVGSNPTSPANNNGANMSNYFIDYRPAVKEDGPDTTGGIVLICEKCGGESFRVIKWEEAYSTDAVCITCNTQINVHDG